MPATPSGEIKKTIIRSKRKNGDIYILERESVYIPEKRYNKIISTKLIGKIPQGETKPVSTRPKLPDGEKKYVKSGILTASRERIGMEDILDYIGDKSGIDQTLYRITNTETAQKILSIARYRVTTNGASLRGLTTWQLNHPLPYEDEISENVYHDLFEKIGSDETLQQNYFKARCEYFSPTDGIAYDTTNISTYSVHQADAFKGFNKDGNKLEAGKFAVLYSVNHRQPISFTKQPENASDVSGITNAIKELESILKTDIPELVTDYGHYSEQNLSELLQSGFHTITLADTEVKWIQNVINEHRHDFENFDTRCPFNSNLMGKTVSVVHTFNKVQKYGCTDMNLVSGENETFQQKIYLHIYFDEETQVQERNKLRKDFPPNEKEMINTYFLKRKNEAKTDTVPNNDTIKSSCQYHGYFVLISTKENDTWKCLQKYLRRNTIESCFEADKGETDEIRTRVRSDNTLRGRMFVQFIALSYYEFMNEKIREMKETLGQKNGNPNHDLKDILDTEIELKTWIEHTPLYLQLQWFDSIERMNIPTKLKQKRWTAEIIERDRLYLDKLGVTLQ